LPERPQLWTVAGPNGAGKTSLVSRRLSRRIPVVNPDEIASRLPRLAGKLDERRAGELALREREGHLAIGRHFAVETTLTGASALRLMRRAKAAGYKLTLVYVGLDDAVLSRARVADRVALGGHDVPLDAIARRFPASLANLAPALALVDRAYIFDNSEERRRLLLKIENGAARWKADQLPKWLISAVPEQWWEVP
jgi:predicted ABC-type ATPase